jgi:hypothetical protein
MTSVSHVLNSPMQPDFIPGWDQNAQFIHQRPRLIQKKDGVLSSVKNQCRIPCCRA